MPTNMTRSNERPKPIGEGLVINILQILKLAWYCFHISIHLWLELPGQLTLLLEMNLQIQTRRVFQQRFVGSILSWKLRRSTLSAKNKTLWFSADCYYQVAVVEKNWWSWKIELNPRHHPITNEEYYSSSLGCSFLRLTQIIGPWVKNP